MARTGFKSFILIYEVGIWNKKNKAYAEILVTGNLQRLIRSTGYLTKAITEQHHNLYSMSLCGLLHRDALWYTLHHGGLSYTQHRDE